MHANYYDCDPLVTKKVEEADQVRLDFMKCQSGLLCSKDLEPLVMEMYRKLEPFFMCSLYTFYTALNLHSTSQFTDLKNQSY